MDAGIEKECSALGGLFQVIMNDMKTSYPTWEDFVTKGTKLQSQLRTTITMTGAFLDAFQKVADMATGTRGATKDIGSALTRMCMRHRSIESKLKLFTTALSESLITPLEGKMEEWKKVASQLDKDHAKEYKKARADLKKKYSDTIKLQKKVKKGKDEARGQLDSALQDVNVRYAVLEETEKRAVCRALIEERARYCSFVSMLKPVLDHEINMLGEVTHLQTILEDLINLTAEPNKLPPSSEQVILDLKGSEFTYTYQTLRPLQAARCPGRAASAGNPRNYQSGSVRHVPSLDSISCAVDGLHMQSASAQDQLTLTTGCADLGRAEEQQGLAALLQRLQHPDHHPVLLGGHHTLPRALSESLITPLEGKMEEWKKVASQLDKDHAKEYKKARADLKKKSSDTIKLQKKVKKGKDEARGQLDSALQDVNVRYAVLEETEKRAVCRALIEERARYCSFVSMLKPVLDHEINMLGEVTHLQTILEDLINLTAEPNKLPPSSEQDCSHPASQPASGGSGEANGLSAPPLKAYLHPGERVRAMSTSGKSASAQDQLTLTLAALTSDAPRSSRDSLHCSSGYSTQTTTPSCSEDTIHSHVVKGEPSFYVDYESISLHGDVDSVSLHHLTHGGNFDKSSTIPRNSDLSFQFRKFAQSQRPTSTVSLLAEAELGGRSATGVAAFQHGNNQAQTLVQAGVPQGNHQRGGSHSHLHPADPPQRPWSQRRECPSPWLCPPSRSSGRTTAPSNSCREPGRRSRQPGGPAVPDQKRSAQKERDRRPLCPAPA
ncbi:unnamed protein product [Tetraodon nigroviridis]|uniref:(spotted green pufferfish) hypothetical protein n=1 Tax=Tetraodon nigroviridis TaxID=99883 RepID=Q4SUD9_TETNG|nr:unnamed protein product [Tetraodon nigroviridis]